LSQVLVPIASDSEPRRESQQWSLNHLYNIRHFLICVKWFLVQIEQMFQQQTQFTLAHQDGFVKEQNTFIHKYIL